MNEREALPRERRRPRGRRDAVLQELEAARSREARVHAALAAAGVGTWEWNVHTGEVTWSQAVEAIHGLPPGAFGGTFDAFLQDIHPDDRERVLRCIQQAVADRAELYLEYRIVRPDGGVRWVEGRGRVFPDADGRPARMTGVCMDITARKRDEQILHQHEQEFRALVENAPDIIARFDRECRHVYVNPAVERSSGLPASAFIGRTHEELGVDPDMYQPWQKALRRVFRTGREHVMEFELPTPHGSRYCHARLVPEMDASGATQYVLAIIRDITERRRAEQERDRLLESERAARAEAEEAVRQREEFLSIASHDLKTPLALIKGLAQTLLRRAARSDGLPRDYLADALAAMDAAATKMNQLIDGLLDVSRIQQGRLELRPEPMDLRRLATDVLARFQHVPERTPAHTLVLDAPEPLAGYWDPARLDQVLSNLISNALKYSPEGGRVRVTLRRAGAWAELAVQDPGIGIGQEDLARLFRPFSRGSGGRRTASGEGLGLYITQQLVERHGGTVAVESRPGCGTTVTVRLPLQPPPDVEGCGRENG